MKQRSMLPDEVKQRSMLPERFTDYGLAIGEAVDRARAWLASEHEHGTLIAEETLWHEAYSVYASVYPHLSEQQRASAWSRIVSDVVFDRESLPLSERTAMRAACGSLLDQPALSVAQKGCVLERIANEQNVDPWKLRVLLEPGASYPWMFPRVLWSADLVARSLEAILAPFEWKAEPPDSAWLLEHAVKRSVADFLTGLQRFAAESSPLERVLAATRSFVEQMDCDGKDMAVIETHSFIAALASHGLEGEVSQRFRQLLALREAVALLASFHLYQRAERSVAFAEQLAESAPESAIEQLSTAANVYKRLSVAQMFPDRVLARQHYLFRLMAELRADHEVPDQRRDHVLLVSTHNSPGDLQRLLLSVRHELMSFAYGKKVHIVISDDSTEDIRRDNEQVIDEAVRSGMSVSHWTLERRARFLAELNREVFPDGSFDVRDLAGPRKAGEKGIPYGRLRNFLRLAALHDVRESGLHDPVFTWLDQDNELGALVLKMTGRLAKRHVFNYFGQKNDIFDDRRVLVAGGGYTNDALEGVEKFWVAWGVLHNAIGLAEEHSPDGPAVLHPATDITRFRPWDQPDTLERLPREGEAVGTMSDQFMLLLKTLIGTFRGKYDNQVQIYHPWTYGDVVPEEELLVEEMRPFAGMPGGNTSLREEILASSIPFLTVGGRGEDIFHLWQLEARYGSGTVCLAHTPAIHTRNVRAGRGDLMNEIIDSYNGRIFREPPYVWSALSRLSTGNGGMEVDAAVEARTLEAVHALRAEAKASIAAVGGFAAAIEPYLDEGSEFWWIVRARSEPPWAELLGTLRGIVQRFKDVERYHREADENLFGLEEIKELTERFISAYPRWQSVVEHVGGPRGVASEEAGVAIARPLEAYGSPHREPLKARTVASTKRAAEAPILFEPSADPPWQEVLTSSLLLFHRWEQGSAEQESWHGWHERVRRLRSIYEHYAAQSEWVPDVVWTRLFRDSLFVPNSRPYQALTALLDERFALLDAGSQQAEITALAARFEVEEAMLRLGAWHIEAFGKEDIAVPRRSRSTRPSA